MEPNILLSKKELVTVQGPGNKPITLEISLQVRMDNDENRSTTATSEVHAVERGDMAKAAPIARRQRKKDGKLPTFTGEVDGKQPSLLQGNQHRRQLAKSHHRQVAVEEDFIMPTKERQQKVGNGVKDGPDWKLP